MAPASGRPQIEEFKKRIIDEIVRALGLPPAGVARRLLGPLFGLPAGRFAGIVARADGEIGSAGLPGAARSLLAELGMEPIVWGERGIPEEGPLLVASNHPGAYDSLAIMAAVPRKDLKVIISDVGLTRAFPAARELFIYAPKADAGRGRALRDAIRHLRGGGALLVYPHAEVEPDPEIGPDAREALADWSRSVEIMLRRVRATRLQLAVASGILLPCFIGSPLVKLRRSAPHRQKLAETLQLSAQMLFPKRVRPRIHLSFAAPVDAAALPADGLMPAVIERARRLLDSHMAAVRRVAE